MQPLYWPPLHAMVDHKHPNFELSWSNSALSSFQATKDALSRATLMRHPVVASPLGIRTNALHAGICAVLEQLQKGEWHPLAFFSGALSPAERCYSVFDHELLAAFVATKHFQWSIEGHMCILFTDHRPLMKAVYSTSDPWSPWQQ